MNGPLNTTVVIATRNRRAELLRTLGKLCELQPSPPIIVVDNASSDETAQAVSKWYPQVCVIRAPRNLGAAARNLGALRATGRYVAFSDDDSWWHGGSLERAEVVFAAHPRVGLIAARTLVGPDERPDPVNAHMARSPLRTSPELPGPRILGFTACAAIARRSAFCGVGGFSPTLFFAAEEKLLACDLAAAGWDLVYVDDIVAHHHPSAARDDGDTRRMLERRNNALIAWMRYAPREAVRQTGQLLNESFSDGVSRRAALSTLLRIPAALSLRRRLPADVEHEMAMLAKNSG